MQQKNTSKRNRALLDKDRLVYLLEYDQTTGVFTWKNPNSNAVRAGDVAGSVTSEGYVSIGVDGRSYQAHRLAWLYVHGEWPCNVIDHIDGDPANNRLENLRDVISAHNLQNVFRPQANSKSGLRGATFRPNRNRWTAQICVNRKIVHLGSFKTAEEAHRAYMTAKVSMHAIPEQFKKSVRVRGAA